MEPTNRFLGRIWILQEPRVELYKMLDQLPDNVDFPHWWQSKIIKAKSMISSAKHYLEFELKEPQIDAMVDVAAGEDVIDEGIGTLLKKGLKGAIGSLPLPKESLLKVVDIKVKEALQNGGNVIKIAQLKGFLEDKIKDGTITTIKPISQIIAKATDTPDGKSAFQKRLDKLAAAGEDVIDEGNLAEKVNEARGLINLKAAMDALNKNKYVDGVKIRQGNKFTGIKSIDVNTRLIGDLVVTKDGEVFWPYKDRTWGWDSPSIEHLIKTIEEVSAEEELNPSNDYKLTEVNEDVIDELKVKVSIPGQEEFEAEEGKDYSEEEADKYIDNAEKSGATPMNTKFTKVNEEEVEEAIQNIESDDATKRRIARLTNQLLQDADPSDETVKAYAISVKNDLESGDTSRMTQYKDILSLDDLKDDMEHYLSHDVDQLEEIDEMDRNDPIAMRLRADKANRDKFAGSDPKAGTTIKSTGFDPKILKLKAKRAQIMRDMEQEAEPEGGPIADRYGDMLNKIDKAIAQLQGTKKEKEYKLMEEEPDVEDLYQHDDEYLATLKHRKALKEMFKKIITKVVND